jgi:hypothetical protein
LRSGIRSESEHDGILGFRRDGCVTRQPEGRERIQRVAMTEDSPPNRIGRAELLRVGPVFGWPPAA